jgi:hypothetical protein
MRTRRVLAAVLVLIGRGLRLLGQLMQETGRRLVTEPTLRQRESRTMQPPIFWPGTVPEPPAHWIERVRDGAPWLLDEIEPGSQQDASHRLPAIRLVRRGMRPLHQMLRRLTKPASRRKHESAPQAQRPHVDGAPLNPARNPRYIRAAADTAIDTAAPTRPDGARRSQDPGPVTQGPRQARNRLPASPETMPRSSYAGTGLHVIPQMPIDRAKRSAFVEDFAPRSRSSGRALSGSRSPASGQRRAGPPSAKLAGRRASTKTGPPETTVEHGWPALPTLPEGGDQDWSASLRRWEHRQRLDAEQRGEPWNALRS